MKINAATGFHISLDNIYNEIIIIAGQIGECKASIDRTEKIAAQASKDIDSKLEQLNKKVEVLYESEVERKQRLKMLWGILQFSPGIFFKILSMIGVVLFLLWFPPQITLKHVFMNIFSAYIK